MTKVYNDVLLAADASQVSVICLLDLTVTFDTVHHQIASVSLVCVVLS